MCSSLPGGYPKASGDSLWETEMCLWPDPAGLMSKEVHTCGRCYRNTGVYVAHWHTFADRLWKAFLRLQECTLKETGSHMHNHKGTIIHCEPPKKSVR